MVGAFFCAWIAGETGSFLARPRRRAFVAAAAAGALVEIAGDAAGSTTVTTWTRCWRPSALILIFSELARAGSSATRPLYLDIPDAAVRRSVPLPGGGGYPAYRLAIIGVGIRHRRRDSTC